MVPGASELALPAIWVPIIRDGRCPSLGDAARAVRAWHARKTFAATETAFHMLPIGVAAADAHLARGVPEIIDVGGLVVEVASEHRR